ncbi:MAG: 3-dehydroquinate synthase [Bacteroidales bacterium]|nr:3-dehydroquinate synthase [Candidatus Colicola coprequi]
MNLLSLDSRFSSYSSHERFVLADNHLLPLYPDLLSQLKALAPGGVLLMDADENIKNIDSIGKIWQFLLSRNATRHAVLICIGGGVISDMGGFAAATYKRGIAYVNIPTTLLAMVDASSGGKTAIDFPAEDGVIYKNSVGVFYPPIDTIMLPDWLDTLPTQQFLSGYAELIKTLLLDCESTFLKSLSCLENYMESTANVSEVFHLAKHALAVKRSIVTEDPFEQGKRKVLNLGHTIGHALEEMSLTEQHPIAHGYAVMYGLIGALYLSVTLLGMNRKPLQLLTSVMLRYYGRPQCTCKDMYGLLACMRNDKKNSLDLNGHLQIRFTLLTQIGTPVPDHIVLDDQIVQAVEYINSL